MCGWKCLINAATAVVLTLQANTSGAGALWEGRWKWSLSCVGLGEDVGGDKPEDLALPILGVL